MARGGVKYYTLREVKSAGKQDGRSWRWKFMPPSWPFWETKEPDPPVNQKERSQYETKLISIAHETLERKAGEWSKIDEKLTPEYCNTKDRKEYLQSEIEKASTDHKDAIIKFEEAKRAFFNFPPRWIPKWLYWLIFFAISSGEGIFNYKVFQIFGQETFETVAMAGAIIISIPVFSEVLGYYLKKETKSGIDKFWIGFSVVVVLALLIVLAIMRESFFKALADVEIPMSPATLAVMLIVINLAFFTALSFLSYAESRKSPGEYRKAGRDYEDALKALQEAGADVEKIAQELAEAEERFNKAHSAREHAFEQLSHKAHEERDIWVSYIRTYRHANISARRDKTLPESFKLDPETVIIIPAVFEKLDWECPGDKEANA